MDALYDSMIEEGWRCQLGVKNGDRKEKRDVWRGRGKVEMKEGIAIHKAKRSAYTVRSYVLGMERDTLCVEYRSVKTRMRQGTATPRLTVDNSHQVPNSHVWHSKVHHCSAKCCY